MKSWLQRLYRHRYFLLFIVLFAYVQSLYIRIAAREEITLYTFTPEAVLFTLFRAGLLFGIILFAIRKWQKSDQFSAGEMFRIFGFSLVMYLVAMKVSGLMISFAFDTIDRNFNRDTFFFTMFSDFLDGIIYGSFLLAYYYYRKHENQQQQLASYHRALSESRIHHLKAQLNPHFLFNNLNVLDQLIEEDKHRASVFLNEFADIYRYVLQATEKKLISLHEELGFAERYFGLIRHKYGNAYQLRIERGDAVGYIVPLTLQLLIENAVQHNLGTESSPVCIDIRVKERIHVMNNLHLKRQVKKTHGRALENVKEQYRLLTGEPVQVRQTEDAFSVIIPIIHTKDE